MIPQIEDIPDIINNKKLFEEIVYTPLTEALSEIKKRSGNKELESVVLRLLDNDRPHPFRQDKPRAVLFRQLVTPNYEVRRFINLLSDDEEIDPIFWEYYEDKFTSNNDWKRSLGKLSFFHGRGKDGSLMVRKLNVIDFNQFVGKKISEVKTFWGESLVDFHHNLFEKTHKELSGDILFDASAWFHSHGGNAQEYYKPFLSLFIKDAILFENFMLDIKEKEFTERVFLPAFIETYRESGVKPLIVALEPTDIEGDEFWYCHPAEIADENRLFTLNTEAYVQDKIESAKLSEKLYK